MQREVWVCVCDLISGRQRHTTQKEWYAETDIHTQRDRQAYTCIRAEREERRGTEGGGKRILGILTLPVVYSMWMGTDRCQH